MFILIIFMKRNVKTFSFFNIFIQESEFDEGVHFTVQLPSFAYLTHSAYLTSESVELIKNGKYNLS